MSISVRIKFSRRGPISYLGHLDVLRYFQKAISRSGLDIRYSEGFNPHQVISFAYPLGVSMETLGDYMDMDLNTEYTEAEIISRLNNVLNEGIEVLDASFLPEKALNAMASVALADYYVELEEKEPLIENHLKEILNSDEVNIKKEGKKETRLVNIRPGILDLSYDNNENRIFMKLLSGSVMNIKPSSIIEYINEKYTENNEILKITRLELYKESEDGKYIPLGEF